MKQPFFDLGPLKTWPFRVALREFIPAPSWPFPKPFSQFRWLLPYVSPYFWRQRPPRDSNPAAPRTRKAFPFNSFRGIRVARWKTVCFMDGFRFWSPRRVAKYETPASEWDIRNEIWEMRYSGIMSLMVAFFVQLDFLRASDSDISGCPLQTAEKLCRSISASETAN